MNPEILLLGKLLVEQLDLENTNDTLSHWMAHYIAEKMSLAKTASGDEKKIAEQECFETILKVWDYRTRYSSNKYPLYNFKDLYTTIEQLNPQSKNPFFSLARYLKNSDIQVQDEQFSQYMQTILNIDKVARICIEFILQQAIASVSDEKTLQWLKLGIVKETDYDLKIIDDIMKTTSKQTDSIEEYIYELEKFKKISNVILERYKQEKESFT